MKECTYYDLLGVPMDATDEEITNAKNFLVKKLHPDANIDSKFDTTIYIQNILYAYRILSNPDKRRVYDRRIRNPIRRRTPGESNRSRQSGPLSPNFAPFWEAANKLNELTVMSAEVLYPKSAHKLDIRKLAGRKETEPERLAEFAELAKKAKSHIEVLESSGIPKQYWHSHAMNWMLVQWTQNREFAYGMLCAMYDNYLEQNKSAIEKKKIQGQISQFLQILDKMTACQ